MKVPTYVDSRYKYKNVLINHAAETENSQESTTCHSWYLAMLPQVGHPMTYLFKLAKFGHRFQFFVVE